MKKPLLIILLLFVAAGFLTLPRIALQNDDASGYAVTVRNTVVFNQWLTPMLTQGNPNGLVDKPPLGIWLLAWAPKLFGVGELTVHIPNVCYFALILLVLYLALARFSSQETALSATLIAATSLCLVVYSRAPKLEVPLTLTLLLTHFALYGYLKEEKPGYVYGLTGAAAAGFLIKSGLGVLPVVLTALAAAVFLPQAREKLWRLIFSWRAPLCLVIFLALTGGVLGAQALVMKAEWPLYLQSILMKSPYNPGYLGLGFHPSIVGLLLIAIFPWTPLFLTGLKVERQLSPRTFAALWFLANFLFLLFCYKFTDLRTFTALVPPLAILAGVKLQELAETGTGRRRPLALLLWQLFFLLIFSLALIALLIKPYNGEGISLAAAVAPAALFVAALFCLSLYFWSPGRAKLTFSFGLICLAYAALFYNTRPLVESFNPQVGWPKLIAAERSAGVKFIIYRPTDRVRFMSPDLFYTDFMAGPADRYCWDGKQLKRELSRGKALVLSDSASYDKLGLKRGKLIARDGYASLVRF
jgi:4-amino-4-deoxy-L-arabinose transferase-like glycosyltransferase